MIQTTPTNTNHLLMGKWRIVLKAKRLNAERSKSLQIKEMYYLECALFWDQGAVAENRIRGSSIIFCNETISKESSCQHSACYSKIQWIGFSKRLMCNLVEFYSHGILNF